MANLQYISTLDNFNSATIEPKDVKFLVTVPKDGGGYESKKISYQDIITRIANMFPESSFDGSVDGKINNLLNGEIKPLKNRVTSLESTVGDIPDTYLTKAGSTTQDISRPTTFSTRPVLTGTQSDDKPLTKAETMEVINTKTNVFHDLSTGTSTSRIDKWRYYRTSSVYSNNDRMYGDPLATTASDWINGTGHSRYKYVNVKEKNFVYHRVNHDSTVIVKANHGNYYVFSVIDSRLSPTTSTKCSDLVSQMFTYAKDTSTNNASGRAIFNFLGITRYSNTGDAVIIPNVKAGSDIWMFLAIQASDWGYVPKEASGTAIDVHVTEISNG